MSDTDRPEKRVAPFEERLRTWGRKPPKTPPDDAARRVLSRLETQEREAGRPRLLPSPALAAAALLALLLGWWVLSPELSGPEEAIVPPPAPVLDDGVVLIWLDPETPLYMTLSPPTGRAGERKGDPT